MTSAIPQRISLLYATELQGREQAPFPPNFHARKEKKPSYVRFNRIYEGKEEEEEAVKKGPVLIPLLSRKGLVLGSFADLILPLRRRLSPPQHLPDKEEGKERKTLEMHAARLLSPTNSELMVVFPFLGNGGIAIGKRSEWQLGGGKNLSSLLSK